jgi:hypothetical protein
MPESQETITWAHPTAGTVTGTDGQCWAILSVTTWTV